MSMKFGIDIVFLTGICLIISPYSPGGANSSKAGESRWALPRILVVAVVMNFTVDMYTRT